MHEMLNDAVEDANEHIVSWIAHGKAFRVHRPQLFAEMIMPRYFKQTKYKSFQRQLHIYGFQRIQSGTDKGAYFHNLFVRHQRDSCLRMARQKIKGHQQRNLSIRSLDDDSKEDLGFCPNEGEAMSSNTEPQRTTAHPPLTTSSDVFCPNAAVEPDYLLSAAYKAHSREILSVMPIQAQRTNMWADLKCESKSPEDGQTFDIAKKILNSCFSTVPRPNNNSSSGRESQSSNYLPEGHGKIMTKYGVQEEGYFAGKRFFFVDSSEYNQDRTLELTEIGARSA